MDLDQYLTKLGRQSEIVSLTRWDRCRGFIAFYCNNTTTRRAYITLMAVSPSDRRTGLGRALVMSVLEHREGTRVPIVRTRDWESEQWSLALFLTRWGSPSYGAPRVVESAGDRLLTFAWRKHGPVFNPGGASRAASG